MGEAIETQPAGINGEIKIHHETQPAGINGEIKIHHETQPTGINGIKKTSSTHSKWSLWLQIIIYSFFVLAGQSVSALLGRLYFNNGGQSQWMATLVQVVGFPVLLPFLFLKTEKNQPLNTAEKPLPLSLAAFYIATGIFLAADCMLFSIGLQYLPVTTFTLISATTLGFNAVFSYFLNNQSFTPYTVNSLVLLTISSALLVLHTDPGDSNKVSGKKYVLGFSCTLAASAGWALMLSVTQLAFQKLIKRETIRAVINMTIYQNLVATVFVVVGLFASGDWRKLEGEMSEYESGRASYVMNLVGTAVSWQAFSVGCVGLIFKVSSLFSNVVSSLGMPVGPVLAVVFLKDELTGLKGVAMVVAMWGFVSYMYQHYLDDMQKKKSGLLLCDNEDVQVDLVAET